MIELKELIHFVEPYYKDKDLMHNLSHIERVLKSVDKLIKLGCYQVDKDLIRYGAYLHGLIQSNETSIRTFLNSKQIEPERINRIIHIAYESHKAHKPTSLEGMVLHDAHMIEGGETFLILKSMITGSVRGQTLEETIAYFENNILNKGTCYLKEAKNIYRKQEDFARNFLKSLKSEI